MNPTGNTAQPPGHIHRHAPDPALREISGPPADGPAPSPDTDGSAPPPGQEPRPVPVGEATAMPEGRPRAAGVGERVLELVALLVLLALATGLFVIGGTAALTAVTSVATGLFITWRTNNRPRPRP
ncbi:hypothetical protein [Kitasatospora sp. NPDC057015]|uniref:hypothetical protein n=1 Tax=Kitasatospora sp. NPDC057015 TaxID=3346001 RepID=UPI00362EC9EF